MSREKQIIEEMAFDICKIRGVSDDEDGGCLKCRHHEDCLYQEMSWGLYNAGYRKQSDLAREIIADFDEELHKLAERYYEQGKIDYFTLCEVIYNLVIAKIKKKYTEE